MRLAIALGAFLMIANTDVSADMIDSTGVPPWEHCALCHGLDGASRMAKFPKIAGQRFDYLEKQLRDFKSEKRSNDGGPMAGITHQFGIAALLKAARWFSDKPSPAPAENEMTDGQKASGRALFETGKPTSDIPACVSCHGLPVKTDQVVPRLEAQHKRYLEKQLTDFRTGDRTNDPDGVMRKIAAALTEQEITNIARYLAAQPRHTEIKP